MQYIKERKERSQQYIKERKEWSQQESRLESICQRKNIGKVNKKTS